MFQMGNISLYFIFFTMKMIHHYMVYERRSFSLPKGFKQELLEWEPE